MQNMKYKSNPIEAFWKFFCEATQIDYDKLSENEHKTMKQILKKSKVFRPFPNHKNKSRK